MAKHNQPRVNDIQLPLEQMTRTQCPSVPNSPNKDYSLINELGYDPYHGIRISYEIGLDQDLPEATYVVYLDDHLDVIWCSTNASRKASPGMRSVLGGMVFLETMPVDHLKPSRKMEFRRLLGEGLKQYLSCKEDAAQLRQAEKAAFALFKEAERRINQWNFEFIKRWYTIASLTVLGIVVVTTLAASLLESKLHACWDLVQFAFPGALGALLFFLVRLRRSSPRQMRLEVSGDKNSYFTTVGAKVIVGMLSAIALGMAMRANLFLGNASKLHLTDMPLPFTLSDLAFLACFTAGFSESLVPRFLTTFARTTDKSANSQPTEQQ